MTPDEILEVWDSAEYADFFAAIEDVPIDDIWCHSKGCVLNGSGVFVVEGVNFSVDRDRASIDVVLEDGTDLGSLVLTLGKQISEFTAMSPDEFFSYLVDVPRTSFGDPAYVMKRDYFVSNREKSQEYERNFLDTAPIWGGFTHHQAKEYLRDYEGPITAVKNIQIPTRHHLEVFSRYAHTVNPFDRFLRLYHCVELLYDALTVFKIKRLDADIKDFSAIMSQYGKTELEQLLSIATSHISDHEKMADCFQRIECYKDLANTIFQKHSKKANPITDEDTWGKFMKLVDEKDMSETKFQEVKLTKQNNTYKQMVSKICCYWIYRVRCSIAHSRVGEYVFEDQDQEFILDFAEPLLLEFVRQVFGSDGLCDLIPAPTPSAR